MTIQRSNIQEAPYFTSLVHQTELILKSYQHWLGKELWPSNMGAFETALEVFEAPFVLASATNNTDPILNYGNQAALNLWGMNWEEFTKTPGRHTAEPMERSQRQQFLESVRENGYIDNYEGIRISKSGKRFKISKAIVWNLIDEEGNYQGQAATFKDWNYI